MCIKDIVKVSRKIRIVIDSETERSMNEIASTQLSNECKFLCEPWLYHKGKSGRILIMMTRGDGDSLRSKLVLYFTN